MNKRRIIKSKYWYCTGVLQSGTRKMMVSSHISLEDLLHYRSRIYCGENVKFYEVTVSEKHSEIKV